jgi:hypothetical protein
VGYLRGDLRHRQRRDLIDGQSAVPRQASMFRRHLSGSVGKPPRRIGQDGAEFPSSAKSDQFGRGISGGGIAVSAYGGILPLK